MNSKLNRMIPVFAALLLLAGGVVPPAPAYAVPAGADSTGAAAPLPDSGLITFRANKIAVSDILEILADRSGMNIVSGPEVADRRISIRLEDTPHEEALNLVVRAAGLGYEHIGGTILVAELDQLAAPTGQLTRIFNLNYAGAERVREALGVISRNVTVDTTSNRLIMHDTQFAIEQAVKIVDALDRKPIQIQLESRLIEVNTTDLREHGIDWEKITKWSTVLTEGYTGLGNVGGLPEEIDFTKFGEGGDVYRQNLAFEVAIDEMVTEGRAKLLSNARVVTLDGTPAEIFAGETVPVIITSLQSAGGSAAMVSSVQLEKIDVGVRLNITPRVSEQGYITTLVEPEVSRILAFVGPDNDLPQTSTRRARTIVRVRDGEKIYLGGLLSEETRKTVKKVPLLGDIPLLGWFFRHSVEETVKLDLVIEITPRIVGDGSVETAQLQPVD